jgi:hypothetical protein
MVGSRLKPNPGVHAPHIKKMLDHLHTNGVELDDNDVSKLVKKLYGPWDLNENPAKKFTHNNKTKKQLLKKNIQPQPLVRPALAKAAFQATGEYEVSLHAFESKPSADQTFTIVCQFITTEYSKHFRSDCTKAKSVGF